MRQIIIGPNEAGQRLDKYLHKYMKDAPFSFFYKMMRKKNIVLNGQKCAGNEMLSLGDEVKLFFAEETFSAFGADAKQADKIETGEYTKAYQTFGKLPVLFENSHILAVSKEAGILSQKAKPSDLSLNEWLIGYLLAEGRLQPKELLTFKPSVCNRLDRNTSGLVLCGKSLEGSQFLTGIIRSRELRKFYRLYVTGKMTKAETLSAWLVKDERSNQVKILKQEVKGAELIKTGFFPLKSFEVPQIGIITYAEAELFTGKTHQIRAHFASEGHPLLGDFKYGTKAVNAACKSYGINSQMLHAYRVEFPAHLPEAFAELEGLTITAPLPKEFEALQQQRK